MKERNSIVGEEVKPLSKGEITRILREYRESTGSSSRWVRAERKGGVGHHILVEIGNIQTGKPV